jgi:serine/threonine protein kinase
MKTFKFHHHFFTLLFFLLLPFLKSQTQRQENNTGYTCSNNNNNNNKNQTNIYPCQTYAYYRATLPNYLDLATISDLFSLSRLMISKPSNISSPSSPLVPNQPLLIPLTCSCNFINTTFGSISYSNITYTIKSGVIDGQVYAIKKMKWNAYEELKILQKVNHGNLVKLEGFCIEPEESNCYLVYEYVENGSLYSWLHEEKNQKLNWITRLRIAIDIANGLLYIHEHTRPKVVHKDIKSSNILLDSNKRAKIANFGLAKSGINAITMHIVGTQGYISPEYLADGIVSTKMDVFSFGVVLLELMSGKEVIDDEGNVLWANAIKTFEVKNEQEKARRLKEWLDKVILKETCSMESLIGVLNVAIACLHRDPSKRPSIIDIVYSLSKCEESGFELSDDGFSSQNLVAR